MSLPLTRVTLYVSLTMRALLGQSRFREAIKVKQAEVAGVSSVRVPRLNLDSVLTIRPSMSITARDEDYEDLLAAAGPYSPVGLRGAVTSRDMRRQWLVSTEEFSRDSILEPYARLLRDNTPFKLLNKKEMQEEENVVRSESQRIRQLLHGVNVSLLKGSATFSDPGAQERHNMLEDIRQDMKIQHSKLKTIVKSSAHMAGDERFISTQHRYDFVKANQNGTAQTRTAFKGAKAIRNSMVWRDRVDSVLYNNTKNQFELAQQVQNDLVRRELSQAAAGRDKEAAQTTCACKRWLAAIIIARLNMNIRPILIASHTLSQHSARVIQRVWKQFREQAYARRAFGIALIKKWWRVHEDIIRINMYNRAANKIKTFILDTKDVIPVMPAIYKYKRCVVALQRQMRSAIERNSVTRKKLLTQYDKVEKSLLVLLVREKVASIRLLHVAQVTLHTYFMLHTFVLHIYVYIYSHKALHVYFILHIYVVAHLHIYTPTHSSCTMLRLHTY